MVDPRTPVLIGAGQLSHRVDRGEAAPRAGRPRGRGRSAGPPRTAASATPRSPGADAVHIVSILSFRYRDPGALVAERVGAAPQDTTLRAWAATARSRS